MFSLQAFADLSTELVPLLDGVRENRCQWQALAEEAIKKEKPSNNNYNRKNNNNNSKDVDKPVTTG